MTALRISLLILFSIQSLALADADFLAKQTLAIRSSSPETVLERTADNVKAIFMRYQVGIDSSSEIISPLQVGGTQDRPVIKVTVKKCVAFVCETVLLDADVLLRETKGPCKRNFLMQADLRRSGNTLRDVYDRLDVVICYRFVKAGEAALDINAGAHRAASYAGGIVQRQVLDFLKLQIQPIAKALSETLRANGASK